MELVENNTERKSENEIIEESAKTVFFTYKKTRISFVLSILVFIIHISTLANYDMKVNFFGRSFEFVAVCLKAIAEVAVPLFFIISAALFFRDYTYSKTIKKLKSRFFSLVIPYLVWNLIWTLFEIICSYTFISNYFIGREKITFSVSLMLEGIFLYRFTIPFWFIFCLIVFFCCCPAVYCLLKSKWSGILTIAVVFVLYCFNVRLPESLFLNSASIIFFLVGAYIGIHYFEWFHGKMNRDIFKFFCAISLLCLSATIIVIQHFYAIKVFEYGKPIILCVYSISLWKVFDCLPEGKNYGVEKESFLIYAMHTNVSAIITKLLFLMLPKNVCMAAINYFTTIVLTIVIIYFFTVILNKFFPKAKILLKGR